VRSEHDVRVGKSRENLHVPTYFSGGGNMVKRAMMMSFMAKVLAIHVAQSHLVRKHAVWLNEPIRRLSVFVMRIVVSVWAVMSSCEEFSVMIPQLNWTSETTRNYWSERRCGHHSTHHGRAGHRSRHHRLRGRVHARWRHSTRRRIHARWRHSTRWRVHAARRRAVGGCGCHHWRRS